MDKETEKLDFDEIRTKALEHKPKMIIAGASAYPRTIDFGKFREICDEVGAILMVDMAHIAGLVAAKLHPDPVPVSEFVTSTTHKTLRGPRSGLILCRKEFAKRIDSEIFPGIQGGPLMHVIAGKAVAFQTSDADAWSVRIPIRGRALVEACDTVFVAGPPDVVDPSDPLGSFEGRLGGLLWAFASVSGQKLAEVELTSPPVFDGMAAANGRLYVSLVDGRVVCLGGE